MGVLIEKYLETIKYLTVMATIKSSKG